MTTTSPAGASLATQLAYLDMEQRHADMVSGKASAKSEVQQKEHAREEQHKAEEKAAEEAAKSSMWGDVASVAKVAAIVGGVGAAAFTGGASLVVVGAVAGGSLTLGSMIAKEAGASDKVVKGMEYTGAGLSVASGIGGAFAGTTVSSELAATGAMAARTTSGAATTTQGVATIGQGRAQSAETDARADAADSGSTVDDASSRADSAMRRIEHDTKEAAAKMKMAAQLQQTQLETNSVVLNGLRG
jgi:hypothetical protein